MKVAIQSGLKLSANARFDAPPPTAYQIKAKPPPCEFALATGGSVHVCSAQGFASVRELVGVDHDSFFASLTQDELLGGDTESSGKSGSIFWFSVDGRYILKSVPEEELQNLLTLLPKYAKHLQENRESLLTRYLAAYRFTSSRGNVTRIVVMNNVLDGAKKHKVYDLKGTSEDRLVKEIEGKCLKDMNFEPITMFMNAEIQERLHAVLRADTRFLERLYIMDYSLIVSIQYLSRDAQNTTQPKPFSQLMGGLEGFACTKAAGARTSEACIFHIGVVDMLTTYDVKKQVAHALKSTTIGHFCDIDTEPPDVYAKRFRNYFLRKILAENDDVKADAQWAHAATSDNPSQVAGKLDTSLDLLVFDDPVKPSASGYSCPLPVASSSATGNLIDFDFMGNSSLQACPAAQPVAVASKSMPVPFDLLSWDIVQDTSTGISATSFDLLS